MAVYSRVELCVELPSSYRVNHTHMVYQEVWSNAAVGQQEREGWVGAEQKGEDSRADALPTPAPGHLIHTQTPLK